VPQWLDIDPHGRVAPGSSEVRTALGERAGRFEWLPSVPDLLVARRTPAASGTSPRPRVLLAGDLSGFPITDFIAFTHQARLTGVLHVVSAEAERAVAFKDGEVRSSRSTVTGERIGEVALKLGLITEPQLTQAMGENRLLGKVLVERGFLTSNDLWRCFHEQITAVFHAILMLRSGIFWLLDEDLPDLSEAPRSVSTQGLLMDGIRRIDELSLFKARIPGPGAFLRRLNPSRRLTLQPVENRLLALVDGQRTVAQVAAAAHLGEFDATKVLYHLAEAGYLQATAEPVVAAGEGQGARLSALASGYADLLRLVTSAVQADARPGFLDAISAQLRDPRAPFAPIFRGLVPAPDGALDPGALLANVGALQPLPPQEETPRLLAEALRELLFFYLFLAGDRLSREADETLGGLVRRKLTAFEGLAGA
jgi:Domain of unknown function (DUF4388)